MVRNVLVTGAAGGIGRATVAYLRATGVNVLDVDIRGTSICCDLGDPAARSCCERLRPASIASTLWSLRPVFSKARPRQ